MFGVINTALQGLVSNQHAFARYARQIGRWGVAAGAAGGPNLPADQDRTATAGTAVAGDAAVTGAAGNAAAAEPAAHDAAVEPAPPLPESLVGILTARRGYEANATVLKSADELLGTLIDELA